MSNLKTVTYIVVQLTIYVVRICGASLIRVHASAPVNPIDDHGILSLHCQVWKVTDIHEVTIFRTLASGETQRLSVDDNVLPNVDERIYLGIRKATDGSTIYFLSIMEATRNDIGEYICKVFRVSTATPVEVAAGSVDITSTYLPSDPVCSPNEPLTALEGTFLTLNCSSEVGNPPVLIQWTRAGTELPFQADQVTHGTISYRQLTWRLTLKDANAVFLCLVSSRAYPNKVQRCHVGPIKVLNNHYEVTTPSITRATVTRTPESTHKPNRNMIRSRCLQTCSEMKSNTFYWIVATTVTGLLALSFLITGIYLLARYLHLPEDTVQQRASDKIYSELEAEQMLYMSLQKRVREYKDSDYGK